MNPRLTAAEVQSFASDEAGDSADMRLRATSQRCGTELLPNLMDGIGRSSAWVLHREMLNASTLHMRVETQGRYLMDLYASFMEEGLDLSRDSHLVLTNRCSCARLHPAAHANFVTLHLEVRLPTDLPPLGQWWRDCVA